MQYAETQPRFEAANGREATDGKLVRRFAISTGLGYSALVGIILVAAPELVTFTPLWALWAVVTLVAAATYIGGRAFGRSS